MTAPSNHNDEVVYLIAKTLLGLTLAAASRRGVCLLIFGDTRSDLLTEVTRRFRNAQPAKPRHPSMRWLSVALSLPTHPHTVPAFPLDLRGTAFQKRVWRALQRVPYGATASYRDIARSIGAPTATRAVAGACGANPISIAVPCHRIVCSDGSISGYRWGVARKRALLALESGG